MFILSFRKNIECLILKINKIEIYADFETTVPNEKKLREYYKGQFTDNPEVYLWGCIFETKYLKYIELDFDNYQQLTRDNYTMIYGISIFSFIKFIISWKTDIDIIFHNLKGFDGHFILPALSKLGFQNIGLEKRRLKLNEYACIVNKNAQIYQIKLNSLFQTQIGHYKKTRKVNIKDNLLLFTGTIKKFGKILSILLNDENYNKKLIDYNRSEGYHSLAECSADKNTLDYLWNDVFILAKFREEMNKIYPRKFWHLTAGATAYHEWMRSLGEKIFSKLEEEIEIISMTSGFKKYRYQNKNYTRDKLLLLLAKKLINTEWLDGDYLGNKIFDYIYGYYNGGMTWLNEQFRGIHLENLKIYDIISDYPAIMNSNLLAPIGQPKFDGSLPWKLREITILRKITNKISVPFLFDERNEERSYLSTLTPGTIIKMSPIIYNRFLKYYQPRSSDFSEKITMSFNVIPAKEIWGTHVDFWYAKKENAKKTNNSGLKQICKIMLNSVYGKNATKKYRETKIWNDQNLQWDNDFYEIESEYYLPWAIFIADEAKAKLIDMTVNNIDNFVYCDTDCWFCFDPSPKMIIGDKLGDWEQEIGNWKGIVRRSKQYFLENEKGKRKIAFAGINFEREHLEENTKLLKWSEKIAERDFYFGTTIDDQLTPIKVFGYGVVLEEIEKNIKPVWDYKPLPEQIYKTKIDFDKKNNYWYD